MPKLNNTTENFYGGKIADFKHVWIKLTSDKWILDTVSGYHLEFENVPYQPFIPPPIKFNSNEQQQISKEIKSMLDREIISEVQSTNGQYISNIFPRLKKDGSVRIILNLKKLNLDIEYHHFKMETLCNAINLMHRDCWFASIDLKDAYYSVKVREPDRMYLRFQFDGKLYEYCSLAQGLCSAPRVFTKLLKPVFAQLRKRGHENVAYIDDSLLVASTYTKCLRNVAETVELVDGLGFTIHPKKSVMVPTQTIVFVGFLLDSRFMTITLTREKADSLIACCKCILHSKKCTIREFAQVIGKMVASQPGVPFAPLYYKNLENEKNKFLKINWGDYDSDIILSSESKETLNWWITNLLDCENKVEKGKPDIVLLSDSSGFGWGGVNQTNNTTTSGHWSVEEKVEHINYLELKAGFLTLKALCANIRHAHIRLSMDNTVAVSYVNNMGGRKTKLNKLVRDIWFWCIDRHIWLSSSHVPGSENFTADCLSRSVNVDAEWMLNPTVFRTLVDIYGCPTIDLFASRINTQLPSYVAYYPDAHAVAVDAFSLVWDYDLCYIFAPFSCQGRVLKKLQEDKSEAVLICPIWCTQPWFPVLLRMISQDSFILPRIKHLLILPQDSQRLHPLQKMRLGAFRLSGNVSHVQAYQRKQPQLSWNHGDLLHQNSIGHISKNGCSFHVNNVLIHLNHL